MHGPDSDKTLGQLQVKMVNMVSSLINPTSAIHQHTSTSLSDAANALAFQPDSAST